MLNEPSSSNTIIVNGAGPVGLTFAVALLDRATQLGVPKPNVQIWDPNLTPWRETVIRLPHTIATSLPEQVQMELWEESSSSPQRLFFPGPCHVSPAVENSRVHDPYSCPPSQYTPIVQIKQFQEATMGHLLVRHPQSCSLHNGHCPPDVMRGSAAVIQSYGKVARRTNPIVGNAASEEDPVVAMDVPCENGLFVLFDRHDVTDGAQDPEYQLFNQRGNGFAVFQSHRLSNSVQVYVWPEHATNNTGHHLIQTEADLIKNGKSFGLRALFDCVTRFQGQENWWWEVSRRCHLQDENGGAVPEELACTLEWRQGLRSWRKCYPQMGEKASSATFEAWFDAVRYQISLNMYKMGIFGSRVENFLHKVRLCYARRQSYRYNTVYTEVENVPVIYLGDSAGSTDFKKGLSCGRGLLCASQLAFDTMHVVLQQLGSAGRSDLKAAFRGSGVRYQQQWGSPEMVSEWRDDFDSTYKYLQAGRSLSMQAEALQMQPETTCRLFHLHGHFDKAALLESQLGVLLTA